MSAASKAGSSVTVLPPVAQGRQGSNEPEEGAGEINPDRVLHASDTTVTLGVLIDVHLQVSQVSQTMPSTVCSKH
jgi:hypothetical protein